MLVGRENPDSIDANKRLAQQELFASFDQVAACIGKQIAAGVLARIESFPQREALLD